MSGYASLVVLGGLLFNPVLVLGQGVSIDHKDVGCVLADKFPRFDARLDPAAAVARARLNFRPEGGAHWYYVEMKPEAGVFHGILPKPQKTLHRFSYYIDVTDKAFHASRTAEIVAEVATGPAACKREKVLAAGLSRANVLLHAPEGLAGAPSVPAGFAADGVVSAAGAGTTTVATGGGIGAKTAILGTVLAAGGAVAVVAATSGSDDAQNGPPPTATPGGPPSTVPPSPPPAAATLTGTWIGNRPTDGGFLTFTGCGLCTNTPTSSGSDVVLNLSQSGSALSGSASLTVKEAPPAGCPAEPNCTQGPIGAVIEATVTGTVSGTDVMMQWTGQPPGGGGSFTVILNGTVSGNRMSGTLNLTATSGYPASGTWAVNLQ